MEPECPSRRIGGVLGTSGQPLGTSEPLDHRSESIDISNAEVRDSPAIPARYEVVRNLIVGPDSEKWCGQCIVNAQSGNSGSHLFGCLLPVVRNHNGLNQHVKFYLLPAFPGLLSEVVDGGVDSLLLPASLVPLTILKGPTEHRETDYVGMTGRMSQSRLAVHADKQR